MHCDKIGDRRDGVVGVFDWVRALKTCNGVETSERLAEAALTIQRPDSTTVMSLVYLALNGQRSLPTLLPLPPPQDWGRTRCLASRTRATLNDRHRRCCR
ncbi:hypothetical protein E2C01_092627 [Portunus trituberculatus]|uniref:Uncharacterized protein n=1 Tax=Portunus trituberculatus TaxID=210409 RepID=A0A5B7JSP2_PORTR|nr:hypothetical protein [Portunus trituberculatus]